MINCHCRCWRAAVHIFSIILIWGWGGQYLNPSIRTCPHFEKTHLKKKKTFLSCLASSSHCIRGIFQQIWWKSFTKTQQCKSIQKLLQSRKANAKVHFLPQQRDFKIILLFFFLQYGMFGMFFKSCIQNIFGINVKIFLDAFNIYLFTPVDSQKVVTNYFKSSHHISEPMRMMNGVCLIRNFNCSYKIHSFPLNFPTFARLV